MFQIIVICFLLTVPINCDVSEILSKGWGNSNSWSNNHNRLTSGRSNWQPITSSQITSARLQNYIPYGVPARPPNYYLPQQQENFTTPGPTEPPTPLPPPTTTTTTPVPTTTTLTPSWPQLPGSGIEQPGSWPQVPNTWSQQPASWPQTGSWAQQPSSWLQQPSTSPQQPGTWSQQPGSGTQPESWPQQPVSWPQQPSTTPQQPGYWPQQPGTGAQQPGTGVQQPGSWPQQSGTVPQQSGSWPQQSGTWPQQSGITPQQPGGWIQLPASWSQQTGSWPQQPGFWSQQPNNFPGQLDDSPKTETVSQQSGSWAQQSGSWPQQPASWPQQPASWSQQLGSGNQLPNQPTYQPISSWLQVNPAGGNQDNKTVQTGTSFVESTVPLPPVPSPVIDLSFVNQPLALSSSIGNVTPMTQAMFLNQIGKDKENTSEGSQPMPEPLPVMMPPSMTSNANEWLSQQSSPQRLVSGQQNAVPLATLWPSQSAWTLQQTRPISQLQQPLTWSQQPSWTREPKSSQFREATSLQELVPQISTSVSMTVPSSSGNQPQVMQVPLQMVPEIQVMTFKATPVQQLPTNQYLPQVFNRPIFTPQSPRNIGYHWATNNNVGNNGWNSAPGGNKGWILQSTGGNNVWSSKTPIANSNAQITYWPSGKRK